MITLLSKFFIKQKPDTPEGRRSYGTLCGLVGIFLNLLLFAGKYLAGVLSHSEPSQRMLLITSQTQAPPPLR